MAIFDTNVGIGNMLVMKSSQSPILKITSKKFLLYDQR